MSEPLPGTEPEPGLGDLFELAEHPRPWALDALPAAELGVVLEQLAGFVTMLNATYAVPESELIPPCWSRHPGLTAELAALWAGWIEATVSITATAARAVEFHHRSLREFYALLPGYLGSSDERCSAAAGHVSDRRPAARRAVG